MGRAFFSNGSRYTVAPVSLSTVPALHPPRLMTSAENKYIKRRFHYFRAVPGLFLSSLRRAGLPQPARLHQEEKPKAETFTPSTVQKLPLPIIKAVFPAFMNLSFEWRSYLSRLGLAFRSALVSLCSRAREPFRALLTKESFFPRFKLPRLKTGIFSTFMLFTCIISA